MTLQDNWRWCRKCQGLFFAGNTFPDGRQNLGVCPGYIDFNNPKSEGPHVIEGSGNYVLPKS